MPRQGGRRAAGDRLRIWHFALLLVVLALVAVFVNAPGEYVRDNRFEFYWAPGHLLSGYSSIWDDGRGLGLIRWDFWPTAAIPYVLDTLGSPAWVTERIWHALELALGGVGMVVLLRQFRPRIGIEHLIAGLLYAFGPASAIFLLPSSLYLGYAFAPWLVVTFVHGARGEQPVRWAALFALIVFASGNVNYPGFPGLAMAALPILPAALFLVVVERSASWRNVGRWCLWAVLLAIAVSAAALVTSYLGSGTLAENLAKTETLAMISANSSWAESWRGLGFWLAYWPAQMPQATSYVSSVPVIVATVITPCAALATLWLSRWRARLLFAAIMILGVAVMVGAFPTDDPSPYGKLLDNLFTNVGQASALRAGFKASGALAMGSAALVGVAVASLSKRLESRGWWLRWVPAAAAIGLVAVVAFPFWSGELYPRVRVSNVPGYWLSALAWLNDRPAEGRVLVLPSTVDAHYRWGSLGDDLFEGFLDRPVVTRAQLSQFQGTAQSANLVSALGDYLEGAPYQAGTLAPIARRLGIRYVLIRNDLRWRLLGRPGPLAFDPLRRDPDLHLLRSFGTGGQNTGTDPDRSVAHKLRQLRPIQIYEVRGWKPGARVASAVPLIVAGDGAAWPTLAAEGLLDGTGPIRYSGDLGARELDEALSDGAGVVVTDTNRRRQESIPLDFWRGGFSYTLASGEELDRSTSSLFADPSSQTVARYPDATRITASSYGGPFPPPATPFRPSQAFDGNINTSWRGSGLVADPTDTWIRVDFRRPVTMSSLRLIVAPADGGRRVSKAAIRFSEGPDIPVSFSRRAVTEKFPTRITRSLEVRVTGVRGRGLAPVGFAEIYIPGVDLKEEIQLPDDWIHAGSGNERLATLLRSAPVDYVFATLPPVGGVEVEPILRRRFSTVGSRDYELSGVVRVAADAPESIADVLVPPDVPEEGTCYDQVVRVDGRPVPIRFVDNAGGLRVGSSVRFEGCEVVHLPSGPHTIENAPGVTVERARLSTGTHGATSVPARIGTTSRNSYSVDIEAYALGRAAVVLGQSYDPAWHASIDEHNLGAPVALDTMTGWIVDRRGVFHLRADVSAQRVYVGSLVVTALGLVLCAWLIVRPTRRRRGP